MRKKYLLKDEGGFTLIEIIAVLVIMGILAAVAVPKFFDLQTKAREKAKYTAISELKVRINQYFAQELLDGETWGGISWADTDAIGIDLGEDFTVTNWTVTDGTKLAGLITFDITYEKLDPPLTYTGETLALPRYR